MNLNIRCFQNMIPFYLVLLSEVWELQQFRLLEVIQQMSAVWIARRWQVQVP